MRFRVLAVACAGLAGGAACLFPSLGDVGVGGSSDGAAEDADAIATGSDGGIAADADFCTSIAPAPTFCDSFDRGAFGASWSKSDVYGAGAAIGTSSLAWTPPLSFHSIVDVDDGGSAANLSENFDGTGRAVDYSFDLYVERKPSQGGTEISGVGVSIGEDDYYLDIVLGPDVVNIEHDGPNGDATSAPLANIPTGRWMNVAWHLDLAPEAGAPSARLEIDGAIVYSNALPPYGFAPGSTWIFAGIGWQSPDADGTVIDVDDVVAGVTQQ